MFQWILASAWVLVSCSSTCWALSTRPQYPPSPIIEAQRNAAQIAADLREARALLNGVTDRYLREKIELLIARAELKAGDIQRVLAMAPPVNAIPTYTVISDGEFANLQAAMKRIAFDAEKVAFIQNLGRVRRFTCTQAHALAKGIIFDDARISAAVALHEMVVNPENFYEVLEAFTFDNNKRAVRERLNLR